MVKIGGKVDSKVPVVCDEFRVEFSWRKCNERNTFLLLGDFTKKSYVCYRSQKTAPQYQNSIGQNRNHVNYHQYIQEADWISPEQQTVHVPESGHEVKVKS